MVLAKYLLPALAATQVAFASSCGNTKVSSQSDADSVASCSTVQGDITIEKSATGVLTFSGVQQVTGNVISQSNQVTSLVFPNLNSIGQGLDLNNMTALTELSAPVLTAVGGDITFMALPSLSSLGFTTGVTKAGGVSITNTRLTSLTGISLDTVGQFVIADNPYLKSVNINNLKNATDLISFTGNYNYLQLDLPNLSAGTNMTFRNISSISIPSLRTLTGQLGFWGVTFNTFSAPNLTQTGDLVFNNNKDLANVSMPVLRTVNGGFTITKCDKLSTIDFPKLSKVTGAIDFSGMFNQAELPKLSDVEGGFNMQSTGNFSCSSFSQLRQQQAIHGTYTCKAKTSHPTTSNGQSGTTGNVGGSGGSGGSSSHKGAAMVHAANLPVVGLVAAFGALVQFAL